MDKFDSTNFVNFHAYIGPPHIDFTEQEENRKTVLIAGIFRLTFATFFFLLITGFVLLFTKINGSAFAQALYTVAEALVWIILAGVGFVIALCVVALCQLYWRLRYRNKLLILQFQYSGMNVEEFIPTEKLWAVSIRLQDDKICIVTDCSSVLHHTKYIYDFDAIDSIEHHKGAFIITGRPVITETINYTEDLISAHKSHTLWLWPEQEKTKEIITFMDDVFTQNIKKNSE